MHVQKSHPSFTASYGCTTGAKNTYATTGGVRRCVFADKQRSVCERCRRLYSTNCDSFSPQSIFIKCRLSQIRKSEHDTAYLLELDSGRIKPETHNAACKFRSQHAVCPGGVAVASCQRLAHISAPAHLTSCQDSKRVLLGLTRTHTHSVFTGPALPRCSITVSDCVSSLLSARRRGSRSSLSSRTNRLRTKPVRRTETPP